MNYFAPGIRELGRMVARARGRWQRRGAEKELARLETELGLLGWQQAEFDPATQLEVDKILSYEREQARLTNESADLSRTISELKTQREQARAAFEEKGAPLGEERRKLQPSIERSAVRAASLRKQLADLETRQPQLDRELRKAQRLYQELLAHEAQTPAARSELAALRQRIAAIPGEIAEWQTRRARVSLEVEEMQKSINQETERDAALAREERELGSAHVAADRALADAISAKEREREKIEGASTRIEKEKTNPYREIGRVLADSHLPPMNQPHALEEVRASRLRVQEIEYDLAKSRADSDAEDRVLVRNAFILLGVIAFAVGLVLGALIHW